MFDPERFVFYDAKRTLMLTVGPLSRREALQQLPGEIVVWDPVLAARLGLDPVPPEVMNIRSREFRELDEDELLRIWRSPVPSSDGRTVFVSPPDALPDSGDAPDWGLLSAGFIAGSLEPLVDWVRTTYGAEDPSEIRTALSRWLSIDAERTERAVQLVDLAAEAVIAQWPILHDNPLRAFNAAAASWPEVRYGELDFDFALKPEASGERPDPTSRDLGGGR